MIYTDGFHIVAPTNQELISLLYKFDFDLKYLQVSKLGFVNNYVCPLKHKRILRKLIKRGDVELMNEAKYYQLYKSFKK